jgi:EAL domain-containing protein (putative c-di-GMP-specific phosphodiesterase class I)
VQLTAAKVDTGQGNLFALPLEVDAVDRMLERSEGVFERPGSR